MTTVRLRTDHPASGAGLMDYGRKTRAEMIAALRKGAERDKARADAILAASDEEFVVETHTGVLVRRNVQEVVD
ncbi:hypothetical protein [Leifsonia aquatica]|uniref:hypothetical protein n=1 Tax=Leifsonia aquatica TaxID=144185 RepID=UPI000468827F|nr:hypothetical protein [Leifsonia aquatica]